MALTSNWKRIRKFINDIHLWLGIGSGLILFVVCLSGTIYTFHSEIDELMNSSNYHVEVPTQQGVAALPIAYLKRILATHVDGHISSVTVPAHPTEVYRFSVKKEGERRGTTYLLNPYTGAFLGSTKTGTYEFFMVMFRLHRWLLLDMSIGRPIVGWSTVVFVVIIVTGLVIWVPQKAKSWKQGLRIKWSGQWKRINHDLHNSLGFYTAIFLLIMALTGLQWSFDWYRSGLKSMLGVQASQQQHSENSGKPSQTVKDSVSQTFDTLSIEALLALAERELPYHGAYQVSLPSSGQQGVNIRKYHLGFFASPSADQLTLDGASGKVLSKVIFSDQPFNERVAASIKALHVGDVLGTFSKIIYFISCLIATSLPVTGTIIWINKLRKKAKRKRSLTTA